MGDFKNLRAWREAKRLVVLSREAIARLPREERFVLGDQWRRAASSAALNIAEGASRRGPKEFRRYLDQARGSLHELEGILELVTDLGYLNDELLNDIRLSRANCARMVYGLLRVMSEKAERH